MGIDGRRELVRQDGRDPLAFVVATILSPIYDSERNGHVRDLLIEIVRLSFSCRECEGESVRWLSPRSAGASVEG